MTPRHKQVQSLYQSPVGLLEFVGLNSIGMAMGSPNSLRSGNHHPLTYSVSMASMPTQSARGSSTGEHRRLDRSASEPVPHVQQQVRPSTVNNASRYKTELCRPYEENGLCKYGDKCQFAHGAGELRSLLRHPKYKTELCRTFHSIGFCPYGPRCHFIHNDFNRSPMNGLPQTNGSSTGSSAMAEPLADNRVASGIDIAVKNFNNRPSSTGDLSPNASSISGSPTSCNGFPVETDSGFSSPPQTAPPFYNKNTFFGQDFIPFSPLALPQQQQQPLSPIIAQRLLSNNTWQSSTCPTVDNLNAAINELSLFSNGISKTASPSTMPVSLSDNAAKLRLPIFSQLAFPHQQFVGTQ